MIINNVFKGLFKDATVDYNSGITYLLSIYYNVIPVFIPPVLKAKINSLNIVSYDRESQSYVWRISLFENEQKEFNWVIAEYLPVFEVFDKHTRYKRECVSRMKRLFKEDRSLRIHEVVNAAKLYVNECRVEGRAAKYVMNPHYFISKGIGDARVQTILTYVDIVRELNVSEDFEQRTSNRNTMS